MNTKSYTRFCLIGLAGLFAVTTLFNRVVDPFWYYRDISINRFNAVKTQFQHYERHIKPIILKETRPQAVIFGNSYFEIGLRPTHPGLTRQGALLGYNFGMAQTGWDRITCNIIYAMENTDLKTVVIGLLPMPLPLNDCKEQLKTMGKVEKTALLFSWDALKASFKTVNRQNRKPTHELDGLFYFHRGNSNIIETVFNDYFYRYMLQQKNCLPPGHPGMPAWSYPTKPQDMQGLENLLRQWVERGIQVKLVIYPEHASWLEIHANCTGILERWQSIYQMAQAVDNIDPGRKKVELWDFQGFSAFLTEPIRNNQVNYWQDPGHFNYEMGDAMLDIIFRQGNTHSNSGGDEFGVLMTPDSVPARYGRFVAKRKEFIDNNPSFYRELDRLRR